MKDFMFKKQDFLKKDKIQLIEILPMILLIIDLYLLIII